MIRRRRSFVFSILFIGFQIFEKSSENLFCEVLADVIAELDISNQHFISEIVESLDQIINDFKIYIDSKYVENGNEPAAYGMKVYKHISDNISRGIVREIVFKDCRMLKLVSEHKALMLKRFKFLQKNQIISEQMVNDYKNVYNMSENTRMLQLKYIVAKNDNILFAIRDNVSRIADEEFRLLSKIK